MNAIVEMQINYCLFELVMKIKVILQTHYHFQQKLSYTIYIKNKLIKYQNNYQGR